jgi:hypothetical protein
MIQVIKKSLKQTILEKLYKFNQFKEYKPL